MRIESPYVVIIRPGMKPKHELRRALARIVAEEGAVEAGSWRDSGMEFDCYVVPKAIADLPRASSGAVRIARADQSCSVYAGPALGMAGQRMGNCWEFAGV